MASSPSKEEELRRSYAFRRALKGYTDSDMSEDDESSKGEAEGSQAGRGVRTCLRWIARTTVLLLPTPAG